MGTALALLGAALSISLGGWGSSIGVGIAGQVAAGVTTEKPDLFGKMMLLQVIPGTQGVYGFLGFFWVLMKLQLLSGTPATVSTIQGLQILLACLPVAITCLISAPYQGKVAASGMVMTGKDENNLGKGVIYAAMVETYAVLGLLATILAVNGIKL